MTRHLVLALVIGCAGTKQTSAPPIVAAAEPLFRAGPAIEDATESVRTYSHATTAPESALPTAGGLVRVAAPLEVAVAVATDYENLPDLNPYIESAKVVDKQGDATDVYIKVPTVIHQYIWARVRFRPVPAASGLAFRGELVDGNLEDLRVFWRLVPVSPTETSVQLELMADPILPLPDAWVVRDMRDGVELMLERFRHRAESRAALRRRGRVDAEEEL